MPSSVADVGSYSERSGEFCAGGASPLKVHLPALLFGTPEGGGQAAQRAVRARAASFAEGAPAKGFGPPKGHFSPPSKPRAGAP